MRTGNHEIDAVLASAPKTKDFNSDDLRFLEKSSVIGACYAESSYYASYCKHCKLPSFARISPSFLKIPAFNIRVGPDEILYPVFVLVCGHTVDTVPIPIRFDDFTESNRDDRR